MGEGSYGQVFEVSASLTAQVLWLQGAPLPQPGLQGALSGKEGTERVVLKRVKQRVEVPINANDSHLDLHVA